MSSPKFLEYEVALLLAKYGKAPVLSAVAKQLNMTLEQLDAMLQKLPSQKSAARPSKKPSLDDVVSQLAEQNPAKAQLLRTLRGRLENRSIFPELKDVRRFFERHGRTLGPVKSRSEALPKILTLLAGLEIADLEALGEAKADGTRSSLGLISDEILRRDR